MPIIEGNSTISSEFGCNNYREMTYWELRVRFQIEVIWFFSLCCCDMCFVSCVANTNSLEEMEVLAYSATDLIKIEYLKYFTYSDSTEPYALWSNNKFRNTLQVNSVNIALLCPIRNWILVFLRQWLFVQISIQLHHHLNQIFQSIACWSFCLFPPLSVVNNISPLNNKQNWNLSQVGSNILSIIHANRINGVL